MLIVDHVRFLMPKDREMQFPAIATVQSFVNRYDQRMKMNDPAPAQNNTYQLKYWVEMSQADKKFFAEAGIELNQKEEQFTQAPEVLLDFSEERMKMFPPDTGKHLGQIYASMCGVDFTPMPVIRRVRTKKKDDWIAFGKEAPPEVSEQLLTAKDDQYTGVVGGACWETYLAASMGLAVVEVIPASRNRQWLSKWKNPYYRLVEETDDKENDVALIHQAIRNIEELLEKKVAAKVG